MCLPCRHDLLQLCGCNINIIIFLFQNKRCRKVAGSVKSVIILIIHSEQSVTDRIVGLTSQMSPRSPLHLHWKKMTRSVFILFYFFSLLLKLLFFCVTGGICIKNVDVLFVELFMLLNELPRPICILLVNFPSSLHSLI